MVRVLLVFVLSVSASAVGQVRNGDFERGDAVGPPQGWFVPTSGYRAVRSGEDPHAGTGCLLLEATGEATDVPFGNAMQSFDAT